jgi:hypothetical protein
MTTQDDTLNLIVSHGLMVRQIPLEVISHWGFGTDGPILKDAEIVEVDGRRFMKTIDIPANAGQWMAKPCRHQGTSVSWSLNKDCLSDTLQEAVSKAILKITASA